MDDYLSKPIRIDALHDALAAWLPSIPSTAAFDSPKDVSMSHADETTHFDPTALRRLVDELGPDAVDVIRDIIDQFIGDAPQGLAIIQAAADAKDAQALVSGAHRFKGQALTLGCTAIGICCGTIEHAAKSGDLSTALDAATQLDELYRDTEPHLREHRAGLDVA
jgi:HPt (histidine-containing phosphotransfer) domain-containing protein